MSKTRQSRWLYGWLFCLIAAYPSSVPAGSDSGLSPTFAVDLQLTATVEGRVLDGDTRAPIAGASVDLAGQNDTTDAQGEFSIPAANLASDNQINVSTAGYASYVAPVGLPPGATIATLPDIYLYSGVGPIVTDVHAQYGGIFIDRISAQNTYTATVDWNGTTPGSVKFYANGVLLDEKSGAGPNYSFSIDMVTTFQPSFRTDVNRVEVVAVASGGVSSTTYRHPVAVVPMPPGIAVLLDLSPFTVGATEDEVHISVDFSVPEPGFDAVLDLPVIGKFGAEIAANASFDYTVTDGDWEAAIGVGASGDQGKRGRRPTIPGLTRYPKMKLYVGNKEISGMIEAGARGTATISEGIVFREVFGHGEIEDKLELGRVGLPDLLGPGLSTTLGHIPGLSAALDAVTIKIYVIPGVEGDIVFALIPEFAFSEAELTGKVGLEAAYEPDFGFAKGRIYVGGEPSVTLGIPEPLLRRIRFRAYAGAEFEAWILKVGMEYVFVDVSVNNGVQTASVTDGSGSMHTFSVLPAKGNGQWRPITRDYLNRGNESFVVYGAAAPQGVLSASLVPAGALDAFRQMGSGPIAGTVGTGVQGSFTGIGVASVGGPVPASVEQADLTLVANVFPSSEPSMAAWNDELMLLYVGDNGSSNTLQCTDIRWTHWDGTDWSLPTTLEADTRAEFAPQVAFDGNGDAIALWERISDPDFTNATLDAIAAEMEIAWSRWDRGTGLWTTPQTLTTNTVLDHAPLVCGPMHDGSLLAVWTRNQNNLRMGTNGAGSEVLWAQWNASSESWSAEQTLSADLPYRLSQSLDGATNHALYAWSRDLDGVLTNATDQQVFRCTWNGSAWAAAEQVTTNDLGSGNVRVAVSSAGDEYAIWQEGSNLVMSQDFTLPANMVRQDSGTAGFSDYAMTFGPAGNLVCLWQEMTEYGSDAHYRVYDPLSQTWSRDALLYTNLPLERSFAPVWDNVGNLSVAYNRVDITLTNKTVELEGGGSVVITNVPQAGRVDLCVTKRALIHDLTISAGAFTASGENFLPGASVTLHATVLNAGDVAVSNVVVEFFDGDPDGGGTLITNMSMTGWLEGEATNAAETVWVVPDPSTNHTLYAAVNRTIAASEFNPSNNTQSLSVGGVDLSVDVVDYSAETNGSARIIVRVQNGGAPSAANSMLAVRRCNSDGTGVVNPAITNISVPELEPGHLAQLAVDLPAGTQSEGYSFYQIQADDGNITGDVDRSNNVALAAVWLWVDADEDGIADGFEDEYAFLSSTNAADADADYDNDGASNLAEFLAGTDPDDPASCLSVSGVDMLATNGMRIAWDAVSNRFYAVDHSTNLVDDPFEAVVEHIQATPPANVFDVIVPTNAPQSFYRIRLE